MCLSSQSGLQSGRERLSALLSYVFCLHSLFLVHYFSYTNYCIPSIEERREIDHLYGDRSDSFAATNQPHLRREIDLSYCKYDSLSYCQYDNRICGGKRDSFATRNESALRRQIRLLCGGKLTSHVAHVRVYHVAHVRVYHVEHVRVSHVGHVRL